MPEVQTTTNYTLYKSTEIIREKNKYVEDVEHFLTQASKLEKTGQYFKHALNKTLKINIDQDTLDFFDDTNNIDYVSIKNVDDTNPVYYFVNKKRWIAEKTIELELTLDTIQTFTYSNYELSEKTTVLRQHENRFLLTAADYMRRLVDVVPEEATPELFKTGETNVVSTETADVTELETNKFYLFYANKFDNQTENPLNGFGCFKGAETIFTGWLKSPDTSAITNSYGYLVYPLLLREGSLEQQVITSRSGARITIEFYDGNGDRTVPIYYDGVLLHTAFIYLSSGAMKIQELTFDVYGAIVKGNTYNIPGAGFTVRCRTSKYGNQWPVKLSAVSTYQSATNLSDFLGDTLYNIGLDDVYARINGVDIIDRTSTKLMKIIELPYNPQTFKKDADHYNYISLVDTDFGTGKFEGDTFLQLKELNAKFGCQIYTEDILDFMKSDFNKRPTDSDDAEIGNESKLFNSNFYLKKFVYDSFVYLFSGEKADGYSAVETTFIPTSTINSKFAFKFKWFRKNEKEDFGNILLASRNNELAIYNSSYLNYIRTGYNYDVKTRENAQQVALIGAALQIAAGAASAALTPATGGLSAAVGVSLVSTGVNALISSEVNKTNAALAQAQKMEELKNQSTNVSGSDDIDLLNAYCGNKAKIVTYSASEPVKNALWTLFRFYGYKSNKRGDPTDFSDEGMDNERYWYNFVQCEPVFKEETNLSDEILNDITQRYKEGVTFFHKRGENGVYDMSQEKENWETFLIGHRDPDDPAPSENPLDDIFEFIGEKVSDGGHWLMTPPVYGDDTTMASNVDFQYFVFKGNTADPQYYFTAVDRFGNTYKFEPENGYKCKITMTRLSDEREFTKEIDATLVWKLSGIFTTVTIPWTTAIAEPFEFSLEAQYI